MRLLKNRWIGLLAAALLTIDLPTASAQTSSINAFSPYTMYGIGEINTPGTLSMRSMGGTGVAARMTGTINLLNPAGYSLVAQKSFTLNVGLEGQNYYNYQTAAGAEKKSGHNSINIREFAILMPLYKNLGFSLSVTPYSSVGYRVMYDHAFDENDPVWGNVGRINYSYSGEGDVTEVKAGIGYEIFKNFSVGAALQYYWGDIDRTFVMTPVSITGDGSFGSVVGESEYAVSRFKGQVGVQWNPILTSRRILTLGAAFDFGGDLRPKVSEKVYGDDIYSTAVQGDTLHLALSVPRRLTVGACYQTTKWVLALDYSYENWARDNRSERTGLDAATGTSMRVAYADTHTIKAGIEFTPARFDARRVWRRWSYRAGLRAGTHNRTYGGARLHEYAFTAGVGIPVRFRSVTAVDIGFEYGLRGYNVSKSLGLVRQQYFKFGVSFKLFAAGGENHEYWFMRPRYD